MLKDTFKGKQQKFCLDRNAHLKKYYALMRCMNFVSWNKWKCNKLYLEFTFA